MKLKPEKKTGFEPMTSTIPVQSSTDLAVKPSGNYKVKNANEYMKDNIYLNCGERCEFMIDHNQSRSIPSYFCIFNTMKRGRVVEIPAQFAFTFIICSSIWNLVAARDAGMFVCLTIQVGVVMSIDSITDNLSSAIT